MINMLNNNNINGADDNAKTQKVFRWNDTTMKEELVMMSNSEVRAMKAARNNTLAAEEHFETEDIARNPTTEVDLFIENIEKFYE